MAKVHHVAVLVGSLRKASLNRRLALTLRDLAPDSLALELVDLGGLPIYNQDDDADPAPACTAFRDQLRPADAVLFVTPEYNRSIPGVLKNALDIGSRPYGSSVWDGKPGAVISASPSGMGAFGANHHLRQTLVFLNVLTMQQPEAYIAHVDKLFDEQGTLQNDSARGFLKTYIEAFAAWVERLQPR